MTVLLEYLHLCYAKQAVRDGIYSTPRGNTNSLKLFHMLNKNYIKYFYRFPWFEPLVESNKKLQCLMKKKRQVKVTNQDK